MALDEAGEHAGMDERQIASERKPSGIGCLTESRKKSSHWTFRCGFVAENGNTLCTAWDVLFIAQREISLRAKPLQ